VLELDVLLALEAVLELVVLPPREPLLVELDVLEPPVPAVPLVREPPPQPSTAASATIVDAPRTSQFLMRTLLDDEAITVPTAGVPRTRVA
jgi:hypothetical protein